MEDLRVSKSPAGAGETVLYLDFDGVLHPENVVLHPGRGPVLHAPSQFRLFQHVGLLESELAPYPRLRIVLSTSWVMHQGFARTARRLPLSIRDRIVGAIFHSSMDKREFRRAPRGMQVWSDVLRRRPRDWLAVDDDFLHWPAWCRDKYVRTHEQKGLSDPAVLEEFRVKLQLMNAE